MSGDRLVAKLREIGIDDERVLGAIAHVPRDLFVPAALQGHAYENTALPIGQGQTISQPQIVALMTMALGLTDRHKVLEIGTGSGYQTAILGLLCRRVYTVERHKSLLTEAERRLHGLRIANVTTRHGDGALGWPEQVPFDRIIVTAAAEEEVPPTLVEQLAIGGIMVCPVARSPIDQRMLVVTRLDEGFEVEDLGAVRFVPLVSDTLETLQPQTLDRALRKLRRGR